MTFHTRLSTVALILALAIVVGFALSVPRVHDVRDADPTGPAAASTTPSVSLRDAYKKGIHTMSGSVIAPDACTGVSVQASLTDASSTAPSILLLISMPEDTGRCLQVPTKMPFSTTIRAPAGAAVETRVNGNAASTSPA